MPAAPSSAVPVTTVPKSSFYPGGLLGVLSKREVAALLDTSQSGLYTLFRNCALAVLNCGNEIDDGKQLLDLYRQFDIEIVQEERGIKLKLIHAPANAYVDGSLIQGIKENLVAVVRDVLYAGELLSQFDLTNPEEITDAVFHMLRNAGALKPSITPDMVVCWGGHSISREEYDYTKEVGYQLGLRSLNVCTGCGPGAMKGPMKGAAIGHAKQRKKRGRYVGISEPGIIAAESPNPIVNELVIMPDIEKRLEAFVRCAHGIIVFPGGVGTMEEILYLLGVLLHPENTVVPFPLVLAGPASAAAYFKEVDEFIARTLGAKARGHYQIIVDDSIEVAKVMAEGMRDIKRFRRRTDDAYYFNWVLKVDPVFQQPFTPTHDNMRSLNLHRNQPDHQLASNLRRAFSGIVAGNVKDEGIRAVEQFGPFEISGDRDILDPLDQLLQNFVKQHRMKLAGTTYQPCYRIV